MSPPLDSIYQHLASMTDQRGLFEHARFDRPRPEHGYCTDDNARMLVVTARERDSDLPAQLSRVALAYLLASLDASGRVRNRMSAAGEWSDDAGTNDCWGRCLWGLGVAAAHHDAPNVRAAALAAFEIGALQRSRWPRATAFAALGAADVLATHPSHAAARDLLRDTAHTNGAPLDPNWIWPERRLTYANAVLAEATIATGHALDVSSLTERGLSMLGWLLDRQSERGHLSVTGDGGCDRLTEGPQFDQQPIEVASMADACWRAYAVTGAERWTRGIEIAAAWFDGENDTGARMWDPNTGGSFDGLLSEGVNLNQGAESTLALISTTQRARTTAALRP